MRCGSAATATPSGPASRASTTAPAGGAGGGADGCDACATLARDRHDVAAGPELDEHRHRNDEHRDDRELHGGATLHAPPEEETEGERREQQAGLDEQRAAVGRLPELGDRRSARTPRA